MSEVYISTKQASEAWGDSLRVIQKWCKANRIVGALKIGRDWMIPKDSKRPQNKRSNDKCLE